MTFKSYSLYELMPCVVRWGTFDVCPNSYITQIDCEARCGVCRLCFCCHCVQVGHCGFHCIFTHERHTFECHITNYMCHFLEYIYLMKTL
jgi:hypothetical protein